MIAPYMPGRAAGRPRTTALRAVTDAIFYIAQSGCQWRLLPKEFPPYTTVQRYFYRWRDDGQRGRRSMTTWSCWPARPKGARRRPQRG